MEHVKKNLHFSVIKLAKMEFKCIVDALLTGQLGTGWSGCYQNGLLHQIFFQTQFYQTQHLTNKTLSKNKVIITAFMTPNLSLIHI